MYTQHFGLEKTVFDGGIAQNDDLFLGERQQRVAANLKIGLTTRDAVVTLTGPLGVGKTTIGSEALRITSTRMAQTWVGNTRLVPDEMLELLLAGFELAPFEMGRVQRIHTWRQFMGEMSVTDTPICILVENALVLGPEGLQALEALTAADPNDCPGANLVLMGTADLHELLEEPDLAPLKQRIRSRQRLDPMAPQEVEQYLRHRVAYAGGDYDTIFAPGTAAMVHCFSAGIPRVINNVCETALTVAANRKATQLSPEIVQRVAEGVYGLAPSVQIPEAPTATAPEPVDAPVAPVEQPNDEPMAELAPAAAPVTTVEQPTEESVLPADPSPVDAAAPADETEAPADAQTPIAAQVLVDDAETPIDGEDAPVDAADAELQQPETVAAEVPLAAKAPVAAEIPVTEDALLDDVELPVPGGEARIDAEDAEPQQPPAVAETTGAVQHPPEPPVLTAAEPQDTPAISATSDSVENPPEPPVLTEAVADDAQALEALLVSSTTESVENPSDLPVLTDEVDLELPSDSEVVAGDAQPLAASLPADAPALPDEELQPDEDFSEDIAGATHLHEISEEMAELLFSADPETSATGVFEAAVPLDSDDLELTPGGDGLPKSEEDQTEPEPAAARTVLY